MSSPEEEYEQSDLEDYEPASEEICSFWTALPHAEVYNKDGYKFIKLVAGTSFLGFEVLHHHLMYRDSFDSLCNTLDEIWKTSKGIVIFGNSGIGKSTTGYQILHKRCLKRQQTVYYKHYCGKTYKILFRPDGAYFPNERELDVLSQNKSILFICDTEDSWVPHFWPLKARILCFTSLHSKAYKGELKNYVFRKLYMDVWSCKETVHCGKEIFSHLPESSIAEAYRLWGGIPRYVLEKHETRDDVINLEVKKCDLDGLKYTGSTENRLMHMRIGPNFSDWNYLLASEVIAQKVAIHSLKRKNEQFLFDLRRGWEFPSKDDFHWFGKAAYKEALWKGLCHDLLETRNPKLDIRQIHPKKATKNSQIKLQFTKTVIFNEFEELGRADRQSFYRPGTKDVCGLDGFTPDGKIFCMTGSWNQVLEAKDLRNAMEVLKALGFKFQPSVWFLIPPKLLGRYPNQAVIGEGKEEFETLPQYACSINIDAEEKYIDLA